MTSLCPDNDLAVYQSMIYGNDQLLLRNNNSLQETKESIEDDSKIESGLCNRNFDECPSAANIMYLLDEYKKIITNENESSEANVAAKVYSLINQKFQSANYSDLSLWNDFFHLKYDHSIDKDPNKLVAFRLFISKNNSKLACHSSRCKGYKRYCRDRETLLHGDETLENATIESNSYNLLSRIHALFLHSMSNKTIDVQSQYSNNKKYISSECGYSLNYKQISIILNHNNILITNEQLQTAIEPYGYDKKHLIDDLCDSIFKDASNVLLRNIFAKDLNCKSRDNQQNIFKVILYQYISIDELNAQNFAKMVEHFASTLFPEIIISEITQVLQNQHLDGTLFKKETKQYKNSAQFANIFKNTNNWKRKQWGKIYTTINKQWGKVYTTKHNEEKQPEKHAESETKIEQQRIQYVDPEHIIDEDIINLFCAITTAEKEVAAAFLINASWNIDDAMNAYYALSGSVAKLGGQYAKHEKQNENYDTFIYHEGIKFWYWKPRATNEERCFIKSKYDNLKEEALNYKVISVQIWNNLQTECQTMTKVDMVKKITANGKNKEVYGLKNGDAFGIKHLTAVKLYTDFSTLNRIFCSTFRLQKLTKNIYERMESLKRRNQNFAIWSKLLIESVQNYGTLALSKTKYYRGISQEFLFKKFIARFHVPLSTTTDLSIAARFAGINGLMMELKAYNNVVSGFYVSMLSDFENEKETLFFGGETIMIINSIYSIHNTEWQNYKKHINGIQQILKVADGTISWHHKNNIRDIVGYILPNLFREKTELPPYIKSLLNFHLKNVPSNIEYDLNDLCHNYQWVKDMFIRDTVALIPNVSNLCNLFKHCKQVTIKIPDSFIISNMNKFCQTVLEDVKSICNQTILIEFQCPSKEISSNLVSTFEQHAETYGNLSLKTQHAQQSVFINAFYISSQPLNKNNIEQKVDEVGDYYSSDAAVEVAKQFIETFNSYINAKCIFSDESCKRFNNYIHQMFSFVTPNSTILNKNKFIQWVQTSNNDPISV
eukprot:472648_1